ncbi:MAG TPA: chemotaxis protein CheW [Syntrophorhabdales bacterium]|nr:chemotaxis protein CheW [Syntrophorhabdales bacterium]
MASGAIRSFVAFNLGNEEFAVDITKVQEINRWVDLTRIPNTSPHVQGVMNLRGKIVPVIDLRSMLGFDGKPADKQTRIIVVEDGGVVAGFLVDAVSEVVQLPESAIEAPPSLGGIAEPRYVAGVGRIAERLVVLLDLQIMFQAGVEAGEGGVPASGQAG